jgi:hypothetical protein
MKTHQPATKESATRRLLGNQPIANCEIQYNHKCRPNHITFPVHCDALARVGMACG